MSGRKKLIIGNWKLHFSIKQAAAYAKKLSNKKIPDGVDVVVAPHTLALSEVSYVLKGSDIKVASQNAFYQDEGAYTGEVAMSMLKGLANYVLVGHSERRILFGETDKDVSLKVAAAVRSGITPVLCIGETLTERQSGHTMDVIHTQLVKGVSNLTTDEIAKIVIAYEPVWAISNGKDFAKHDTASAEDAFKAQKRIRQIIENLYGSNAATKVRVLYGASSRPDNAASFLSVEGIDGLLPGGASLIMQTFWPMVETAAVGYEKKIPVKQVKKK